MRVITEVLALSAGGHRGPPLRQATMALVGADLRVGQTYISCKALYFQENRAIISLYRQKGEEPREK